MSLPYFCPPARPFVDPPDPFNNTTAYTYPQPLHKKKGSGKLSKASSAAAKHDSEYVGHDANASQDLTGMTPDQVHMLLRKFLLSLPGSSSKYGLGTAGSGWEFPLF